MYKEMVINYISTTLLVFVTFQKTFSFLPKLIYLVNYKPNYCMDYMQCNVIILIVIVQTYTPASDLINPEDHQNSILNVQGFHRDLLSYSKMLVKFLKWTKAIQLSFLQFFSEC